MTVSVVVPTARIKLFDVARIKRLGKITEILPKLPLIRQFPGGEEFERRTGFNPWLIVVGIIAFALGMLIYMVLYGATSMAGSALNVSLPSQINTTFRATWQMLALALMAGGIAMMIYSFLSMFRRT